MRWLRAMRAMLRVEWRQIRRHSTRSLLVLALIAVPVAAIVGGSGLVQVTQPSAERRAARNLGISDLRIEGIERWQDVEKAQGLLPDAATWTRGFSGLESVNVPGRRLRARLIALEPTALLGSGQATPGLGQGILRLLEGRAPKNAGEVALSPALLEGLDRSLGETVTLEYGASRTITGVIVDPERLDLPVVLRIPAAAEYPGRPFLLVDLPDGASVEKIAEDLRAQELSVLTRKEASIPDEGPTAFIFALGIIGLFEAGLVISAAFGVSLRRRQVEIGLLGSTGATISGLTISMLVSAAILAVLGGMAGTLIGAVSLAALYPWLDGWTNRLSDPLHLVPWHVLGALVLGIVASVLAAVLPARNAAHMPVRQALAGRRPSTQRSKTWLAAGLLMVASGVSLLLLTSEEHQVARALGVILGPIFSIVGFGACSPWLLDWTANRAARLPLAWRLAVRDAGRFRERNGAVVTAVLAGMAMSVTMAALIASIEHATSALPAQHRDDHLRIEGPAAEAAARAIAEQLPTLAATALPAVYIHGEPIRGEFNGKPQRRRWGWIAAGDEELLHALGAESAIDAFREGKLIALDAPEDVTEVTLSSWIGEDPLPTPPIEYVTTDQLLAEPVFLLRTDALQALGLETGPPPRASLVPWLVRLKEPVSQELMGQARAVAAQSVRTTVDASILHGNRFRSVYYVILLICAMTGLIVVIAATALSAAESAADERVLHTVGASPALLRSHQAARAGYLALLGCTLAIPAGLLAAGALAGAVNLSLTFIMPWRDLLLTAVGLPGLVYAGAWLLGKPKGPGFAAS